MMVLCESSREGVKLGAKDNGNASAASSAGQDKFFAAGKKTSETETM
jgi:hypothetical protein